MKVPLLDLAPQNQPLRQQLQDAFQRVLESDHYILGPEVEQFELVAAEYSKSRYAIGVSSGTDALLLALMALNIGPGDEVITSTYSFFATAGAIARVGAKPVFVDIDPGSYNIDPKKIERAITSKTKAIIPVHLYGQCAEMDLILKLAKNKKLAVIEDAAQALGADYKGGRRAGTLGDLGCFSFFPSKNLGALGDAGLVTTQDAAMAEKINVLRVHGSKPKYHHQWVGGNFRIDALQAAFLHVKFPFLDSWTKQRQDNAQRYEVLFKEAGLQEKIHLPAATFKEEKITHYHLYNQFVIRCTKRDALIEHLKKDQIGSEVYYPVPLHLQECFKSLGYKTGDFPESERAAKESLALPIYPGLTAEQQAWVVHSIKAFCQKEI